MDTLERPLQSGPSGSPLPGDLVRFDMTEGDVAILRGALDELLRAHEPCDPDLYEHALDLGRTLPERLRSFLYGFRRDEPAGACLIRGYRVDDDAVGSTPAHWRDAVHALTRPEEMYVGLVASGLGELFTWSTLQNGRLIHNVLPIRGDENEQNGHGSTTLLEWHTEDGFHPARCDYLILMGVRNDGKVPTTYASIRDTRLSLAHRQALSEKQYLIVPDDEHLRQLAAQFPDHPGLKRMQEMRSAPEAVSVLFGSADSPYLRIDPYFMRCAPTASTEHQAALQALIDELERVQQQVVLEPGDVFVIDNYLAVHGRPAFKANFDGRDRWLKKAVVARDLRPSRRWRDSASSRVLY